MASKSGIRCTKHQKQAGDAAKTGGDVPIAAKCCLECAAYLCTKCDASVHSAGPCKGHYRFDVGKLASFLAFVPYGVFDIFDWPYEFDLVTRRCFSHENVLVRSIEMLYRV